MRLAKIFVSWFLCFAMIFSAIPYVYADASIGAQAVTLPSAGLDFGNSDGITIENTDNAWVDKGVIFLAGGEGSYAAVETDVLNEAEDSITVFFNARLFSGPAFPADTERTLLAIGAPASGDDTAETALYVYATSNSINAAIANGTERKVLTVTGGNNILSPDIWRSFALSYSPADGGTLVFYTQGVNRQKLTGVGFALGDILEAAAGAYTVGKPIQTAAVPVNEYRGSLDNIMIWNSALTDAEIAELHVRQRMQRDLELIRLDDEERYMFNEEWIHNPVVHDVMLFPRSRGISSSDDYKLTYESSNPGLLEVQSNANGDHYLADLIESEIDDVDDQTVTLTVTIHAPDPNNDGAELTAEKELTLKVPSWTTRRQMDMDAIAIQNPDNVRENLPLFSKGKFGSDIDWVSGNPAVVSDTALEGVADDPFAGGGVVSRPAVGEDPVNVTLTATVTMDGVPGTLTKEFGVTISPLSKNQGVPSYENAKYLFTFYAENYDWDEDGESTEEMYFAISEDAEEWRTLNLKTRDDGSRYTEPIFQSYMGDMGLRDAHFVRSPDGDRFYSMATDLHWSGTVLSRPGFKEGYLSHGDRFNGENMNRTIAIWDADTLTSWDEGEQRLVNAGSYFSGNAFAPESVWDKDKQAHLVYWQQGDLTRRQSGGIYKCYTRDFVTFTEPVLWYSADEVRAAYIYPRSASYVVDTHIAYDDNDGYYYRFASSNRVFVERSRSLDGPWTDLTPIYHGDSNFEGATTFQLRDGTWVMMLDNFSTYVRFDMNKTGGLADIIDVGVIDPSLTGADKAAAITEKEAVFNENVYTHPAILLNEGLENQRPNRDGASALRMKHGMIMQISELEYWQLIAKYGTMDYEALGWSINDVDIEQKEPTVICGSEMTFTAKVSGEGDFDDTVVWSVEGAESAGTVIDPATGKLTVSLDETSARLLVHATHTHDYFNRISDSTDVNVSPKVTFVPGGGGGGTTTPSAPADVPNPQEGVTGTPADGAEGDDETVDRDPNSADGETDEAVPPAVDIELTDGGEAVSEEDGSTVIVGGGTITTSSNIKLIVPDGTRIGADNRVIFIPRGSVSAEIQIGDELLQVEPGMTIELTDDGVALGGVNISWQNPFGDVVEGDWFLDMVSYVYRHGLMEGTSLNPSLFSPGEETTRGMIATVLYRMEGSPDADGFENPFTDVADGEWYTDAIKWASSEGIVQGVSDNTYAPLDSVTREQLVTILYRYMNYKEMVFALTQQFIMFEDEADISDYAMEAIQAMTKLSVINGVAENTIAPKRSATRAEFAAMLTRFCSLDSDG